MRHSDPKLLALFVVSSFLEPLLTPLLFPISFAFSIIILTNYSFLKTESLTAATVYMSSVQNFSCSCPQTCRSDCRAPPSRNISDSLALCLYHPQYRWELPQALWLRFLRTKDQVTVAVMDCLSLPALPCFLACTFVCLIIVLQAPRSLRQLRSALFISITIYITQGKPTVQMCSIAYMILWLHTILTWAVGE